MADVAFLAQVPSSTLSRLWQEESWLDGVSGVTLQRLITAVPGLARYVEGRSNAARLASALRRCAESGLTVRRDRLEMLVAQGQCVQYLATALEAAAGVMRGNERDAVSNLARCWGAKQSAALDAIVIPAASVLADPGEVVDKALQLIDAVDTGTNCLHTTVGYGILVHKLTRLTGAVPAEISPDTAERCSAFAYRSGAIGVLLQTNDLDTAVAYHRELKANPLLRRNELWSLASFSADIPQTPQLALAGATGLSRTAMDVIGDVADRNDAYLHYLVTTAIPLLLSYDPSFGASKDILRQVVGNRLAHGVADERARAATTALARSIQ
ncbi:hypothetical protein ACL02S_10160 [Nocardia sp. 004]|uniref:hypothetical protein n=1 Tax=Nocardia sp. 004 TaxID=3385978 RepID=UPI0039A3C11F